MPAYLLQIPSGKSMGNKNTDVVVFAEDVANAREFAKAAYDAGTDVSWDNATVTEIADAADFLGWTIRVVVEGASNQSGRIDATHVGIASDGVDEVGAALVLLLNGFADIANSSYDAITNILTVASIADGLGNGTILMTWTPPGARRQTIPSYVGTLVHEDSLSGVVLTVQLNTDAVAIGRIVAELPNRV